MTTTVRDEIDIDTTDMELPSDTQQPEVSSGTGLQVLQPASALEGILVTLAETQARYLAQEKNKEPGLEALTNKLRTFTPNVIKEAIDQSTINHLLQAQDNFFSIQRPC